MILPQAQSLEIKHLEAPDIGLRADLAKSLGTRELNLIALVTRTVRLSANRIRRSRCMLPVLRPRRSRGRWARRT